MTPQAETAGTKTRKRYTAHACMECKRRKRRCSGEERCEHCRHGGLNCVYPPERVTKQRRNKQTSDQNSTVEKDHPFLVDLREGFDLTQHERLSTQPEQAVNDIMPLGVDFLEQDDEVQREDMARETDQPARRTMGQPPTASQRPFSNSILPQSTPIPPANTSIVNNTCSPESVSALSQKSRNAVSYFQQLDLLDRSVLGLSNVDSLTVMPSDIAEDQIKGLETMSPVQLRDLNRLLEVTRREDLEKTSRLLDVYFGHINPHWPCINATQLCSQLAAFRAKDSVILNKSAAIRFATLLNFILATVKVSFDDCAEGDELPGSTEFQRGETLLSYSNRIEQNACLVDIHILLAKTCYHYVASSFNTGYDTVAAAVRLCFQLGLHNEPSWDDDLNFYERTYRQRTVWTIYCLNNTITYACGIPNLLTESDLEVDYPKCVDERMLYPQCPTLEETSTISLVPYLLEVIKWARLSSAIWRSMFGRGGKKPCDPAWTAATDDQIIALHGGTPQTLRWQSLCSTLNPDSVPAFLWQQALTLYLRNQSLRLLLRRQDMLSLRYSDRVAQLCIEIVADIMNALEFSQKLCSLRRPGKYTMALHLVGAMLPVICVIVRPGNREDLIRGAIDLFDRALVIMASLTSGSPFARQTLKQLDRPIRTTREIITSRWPQYSHRGGDWTSNRQATAATPETAGRPLNIQYVQSDPNAQSAAPDSREDLVGPSGQAWTEDLFNLDDSDLWADMTNLYDISTFVSG